MKHSEGKYRDLSWLKIVIPVCIVAAIAIFIVVYFFLPHETNLTEEYTQQVDPNDPINRVINFAELQQINPEIYAWLYVPDTNVDYPVLQHPADDGFYLHHDINGNYLYSGSIYSESLNKTDFSDPVTMLYGHNMGDGTMVTSLDLFKEKAFFDSHEFMYIYTPQYSYKLRIISAYVWGDKHVLKNNDFTNQQKLQDYFNYVCAPDTRLAYVREGAQLTTQDRIVQLSTCWAPVYNIKERYLVTGQFVLTVPAPSQ